MLPLFPRFDFEGALDMSKRTYDLAEEFATQIPKVREARDAMLLEWKGPYGDFLYRHCLENDLENHTLIDQLEMYGTSWLYLWRTMVNETNVVSYGQACFHQSQWDYWFQRNDFGWGPDVHPPIEPRVVDGRFLEPPRWSEYVGEQTYGRRAPYPPDAPEPARMPVRFAAPEPLFVYYEQIRDRWDLLYSYQVPIPPPENHGPGPMPRKILPLRPWNLPAEQGSYNSINIALVEDYLVTSKEILVSLRKSLEELEELWRDFERRSECDGVRSDSLRFHDMVLSEMWRTRQFVKKVHAQLEAGEELGGFEISMPEWQSTPGARRPPSWDKRGAQFTKIAAEAGLVDRWGHELSYDPDDERREKAWEAELQRIAEYAAYLRAHDQMVAEDIARTLGAEGDSGTAPTAPTAPAPGDAHRTGGPSGVPGTTPGQLTSRRYIAGPWYATDEPILDVPGADYPYYDAERDGPLFVAWEDGKPVDPNAAAEPAPAPVVAAAPAVASAPQPGVSVAASVQPDRTDEGWHPTTDPTDGGWFTSTTNTTEEAKPVQVARRGTATHF